MNNMNDEKRDLIINIAKYIICTGSSTRKTSLEFGVSHVTIAKYMNEDLKVINPFLYKKVKEIMELKTPSRIDANSYISEMEEILRRLHEGELLKDIATEKNQTEYGLSKYIHKYLPLMNIELYSEIIKLAEINSLSNLVPKGKSK